MNAFECLPGVSHDIAGAGRVYVIREPVPATESWKKSCLPLSYNPDSSEFCNSTPRCS